MAKATSLVDIHRDFSRNVDINADTSTVVFALVESEHACLWHTAAEVSWVQLLSLRAHHHALNLSDADAEVFRPDLAIRTDICVFTVLENGIELVLADA